MSTRSSAQNRFRTFGHLLKEAVREKTMETQISFFFTREHVFPDRSLFHARRKTHRLGRLNAKKVLKTSPTRKQTIGFSHSRTTSRTRARTKTRRSGKQNVGFSHIRTASRTRAKKPIKILSAAVWAPPPAHGRHIALQKFVTRRPEF